MTGGMLILYMLFAYFEKRHTIKLSPKYFIPLIAAIPGTLLVVLAPGNQNRIDVGNLGGALGIFNAFQDYFEYTAKQLYWCIVIVLFAFIVCGGGKNIFNRIANHRHFLTGMAGILVLCALSRVILRPVFIGSVFVLVGTWQAVYVIIEKLSEIPSRKIEKPMRFALCCSAVALLSVLLSLIDNEYYGEGILNVMSAVELVILETVIIAIYKYMKLPDKTEKQTAEVGKLLEGALKIITTALPVAVTAVMISQTAYQGTVYVEKMNILRSDYKKIYSLLEEGKKDEALELTPFNPEQSSFYPTECSGVSFDAYMINWMERCRQENIDIYL